MPTQDDQWLIQGATSQHFKLQLVRASTAREARRTICRGNHRTPKLPGSKQRIVLRWAVRTLCPLPSLPVAKIEKSTVPSGKKQVVS
jgi:hypothetical protein